MVQPQIKYIHILYALFPSKLAETTAIQTNFFNCYYNFSYWDPSDKTKNTTISYNSAE